MGSCCVLLVLLELSVFLVFFFCELLVSGVRIKKSCLAGSYLGVGGARLPHYI